MRPNDREPSNIVPVDLCSLLPMRPFDEVRARFWGESPPRKKKRRRHVVEHVVRVVVELPNLPSGQFVTQIPLTQRVTYDPVERMDPAPVTSAGMDAVAGRIKPARSSIVAAIEDWQADMERRGCAPGSVSRFGRAARLLCEYAGWATAADINLVDTQKYLAAQRKAGWSGTTHDGAVSALRCWSRFLFQRGEITSNVLELLEASGESGGQGARALTTDEARALVRAARERALRNGRDRSNAALCYITLCHTGLRHAELAALTWGNLDFETGVVITDPAWAKNGRRDTIPMHPELVGLLNEHRKCVKDTPESRVFPSVPNRVTWGQDREAAGIRALDARGRPVSMHSCRKYLATMLDRTGASPGVASRILRHAENLTQARYIDPSLNEEVAAVTALPNLWTEIKTVLLDSGKEIVDSDSARSTMRPLTIPTSSDSAARLSGSVSQLSRVAGRAVDPDKSVERPDVSGRRGVSVPDQGIRTGNGHFSTGADGRVDSDLLDALEAQATVTQRLIGLLRKEHPRDQFPPS
jgi:integrase